MRHIYKSIVVLILVLGCTSINAQTNGMDFTLTSENLNFSEQDISISSVLIKSGETFTWTQNNTGTPVSLSFNIIESSGNWDQNTSLGNLNYTIVLQEETGYVNLTGNTNGKTLVMTLKGFNGDDEQYTFNIDTISYQ